VGSVAEPSESSKHCARPARQTVAVDTCYMYGRYGSRRVERCGLSLPRSLRYLIDLSVTRIENFLLFPRLPLYSADTCRKIVQPLLNKPGEITQKCQKNLVSTFFFSRLRSTALDVDVLGPHAQTLEESYIYGSRQTDVRAEDRPRLLRSCSDLFLRSASSALGAI
jgi:hypothetical protein